MASKKNTERRKIQDTERPHWINGLDAECKRRLELKDRAKSCKK